MTAEVDSLIHEYTRRYVARDVDGVTELCLCPFLAIREGVAIHLADSAAVHGHFMTIIDAYRDAGYVSFSPLTIDTRELGEQAAFTTVSKTAAGMRTIDLLPYCMTCSRSTRQAAEAPSTTCSSRPLAATGETRTTSTSGCSSPR
jgi:hypothetical protein